MPGQLFTQYFLTDGIRATPERRAQAPAFAQFRDAARRLFQDFAAYHNPNETQTEQDLIRPLLELLGWTDDLPQQTSSGGEDIPDLLLFADAQAKTRAADPRPAPTSKPSPSPSSSASPATSAPASTPSTSTSTASTGTTPPTSSPPSPSSNATTKQQFGHYRTKALILAYMNALAAGDTEARMAV